MVEVRRKVLPGRPRYAATMSQAKPNQLYHSVAASRQRLHELFGSDSAQVDQPRHLDAMASAEALDPRAPAVVDVGSDHTDGQPRNARHLARPHGERQVLDEEHRRAVARSPRRDQTARLLLSRHAPPIDLRRQADHRVQQ